MLNAELCQTVLTALDNARPDAILPVLRPLLADNLRARDVRLLLVNYELTALRPVQTPDDDELLSAGAAGRCFLSQSATTESAADGGTQVWLPVSVRGDRIGVLQLTIPGEPGVGELEDLGRVASTLAHAVRAGTGQTDLLARAARSQRLTLPAELQWQLLPGRGAWAPEFDVAGHLEPAYRVHADTFDWCQDQDDLTLSVLDGFQRGRVTPLLSTLALTALRNARRAALSAADQARLAGEAVYAHHRGENYVGALVLHVDLRSGRTSAVLAGSPRLLIVRQNQVLEPQLSDQDPLGMFEDADYVQEHFSLIHGDRILMVSDGVHAARSRSRQRFGDARLREALLRTAQSSPGRVVRAVIDEMYEHRDRRELEDDAVALCMDWTGPSHTVRPDSSENTPTGVELRVATSPLAMVTALPSR